MPRAGEMLYRLTRAAARLDGRASSGPSQLDGGPIATIIEGRARDLGGFSVARLLPRRRCGSVGPIVFFDHMGPAELRAGHGDRRPAASAYRPRDGDLSLRRRDRASGQPRLRAADRARRDQLDDRRAGASRTRSAPARAARRAGSRLARPAALGRAAASARGGRARLPAHSSARRCRRSTSTACSVRVLVGSAYGVSVSGANALAAASMSRRGCPQGAQLAVAARTGRARGLRRAAARSRAATSASWRRG